MAELKTQATANSVTDFLLQIANEATLKDCQDICKLMQDISKAQAKMWGASIIGFGEYKYTYSTGRTGEWFIMGFSPRKANISIYLMGCNGNQKDELLDRLGKHTKGKGCIYIKSLADINIEVLKEMFEISYQNLKV